ncbi:hypothetical protein [Wolinella succinogenes]|uniref:hypothetical protein n=1 Tax=Wolinella succinogenes TaxID=844 RepID=UPI0016B76FBE|nr:hypothetical protein [Wolinella succinogenes]NLU35221.1 hypothetical protein [Wolinella succinogenes]
MDIMGIGAGLVNGSTSTTIPVLKKAMETQETLVGQLLEGAEASGQSSLPSPDSLKEAAKEIGKGLSLDVSA